MYVLVCALQVDSERAKKSWEGGGRERERERERERQRERERERERERKRKREVLFSSAHFWQHTRIFIICSLFAFVKYLVGSSVADDKRATNRPQYTRSPKLGDIQRHRACHFSTI